MTPRKDLLLVPKSRSRARLKFHKNYSGNLCSWVPALGHRQGNAGLCRKQNLQISVTLWERCNTPNLHTHFGCVNISELQFKGTSDLHSTIYHGFPESTELLESSTRVGGGFNISISALHPKFDCLRTSCQLI